MVATPSGWSVCSAPNPGFLPTTISSPSPSASAISLGSWAADQQVGPPSQELQLPVQISLPPLEPNHVRVHISNSDYRDVEMKPEDTTMKAVYEAMQAELPAALLTTYCPGEACTAIFRTDDPVSEVTRWEGRLGSQYQPRHVGDFCLKHPASTLFISAPDLKQHTPTEHLARGQLQSILGQFLVDFGQELQQVTEELTLPRISTGRLPLGSEAEMQVSNPVSFAWAPSISQPCSTLVLRGMPGFLSLSQT